MSQILYARDISLEELEEKFGLQPANQQEGLVLSEVQLPPLTEFEIQRLERVRQHYLHLSRQKQASEETVKLVIVSPLLDLAGFYDPPFKLETETSIEIEEEDEGTIIRGSIDVLVVQKKFWILVIESKRLGFDVMVALPQALAYMLDAPEGQEQVFGLITNGREFMFIRLKQPTPPEYSLSSAFSLYPDNHLDKVLQWLKYLGETIANSPRHKILMALSSPSSSLPFTPPPALCQ